MSVPRRSLPEAASRRGWCPGLARPMPTGDGLLARIHPPLGRLTVAQVRAVAEGARRHGNGHVDVTARANLQVRGVSAETQAPLAESLAAVGLGDRRGDGGPQRLTLTSPLCGLDPEAWIDGLALARRIEAAGLAVSPLPAKTLVAIEPGGSCGLREPEADIAVRAVAPGRAAIGLATEDGPDWIAEFPEADLAEAVAILLRGFGAGGARRVRDLSERERAALGASVAGAPASPPPASRQAAGAGLHPLGDGRVLVAVDAPFGRCGADALDRLADAADGTDAVRLSPSRGFVLAVDGSRADRTLARLSDDFIVAAEDPRRAVAACPGAPACASGSTPTLQDAARLAEAFRPFAARGLTAHVSGCRKGCAEPRRAGLMLVAEDGLYGIVPDGAPGDAPRERLTFEVVLERVRGAATIKTNSHLGDIFPGTNT